MKDENQKNKRILVVDDREGIHDDFRAILVGNGADTSALNEAEAAILGNASDSSQKINFEVDSAFQGQEALEKVKQALQENRPYAMAFVDVRMPPGWDGVETIERIWQVYPELQVVICTAYSDYEWSDIIKKLGQTERLLILKKPFDNVEVQQLANALTEKWNLAKKASVKMEGLEQKIEGKTEELIKTNEQLTKEIAERKEAQEKLEKYG
ncbi:MAG: response regulator, partial [Phycisphaerales bacterium]